MKAIILAGGRGKRLRPLTDIVAKPLLPVHGRPVIEQIIKNLEKVNVKDFTVVTGHLGWQVKEYLESLDLGAGISYVEQKEQLGSAHALLQAAEFIEGDIIVSACDSIYPVEHYAELIRMFREESLDVALSLKVMDAERIKESSVVRLEEDGRVTKIIEKPSEKEIISDISCGPVHVFKESIKDYLPRVKRSVRGEFELPDAIQMMIDDGLRVKGVITESWIHLSNVSDFLELNFEYIKSWLRR